MTLPVTPYRSYDGRNVLANGGGADAVGNRRVVLGPKGMAFDAASLSVLIQSVGVRGRRGHAAVSCEADVRGDHWGDGGAEPSEEDRGLVRGASGSGLRKAKVPAGGAGSRGGGGRPPGRPNMGGVQSDVCACLEEQRPAIFEKVAPVSLMSLVETSGLSIETLGMSRVAGAGVGAAEDGATSGVARGESVIASPPWRVGAGGAIILRFEGLGGLSVIAEAMVVVLGHL